MTFIIALFLFFGVDQTAPADSIEPRAGRSYETLLVEGIEAFYQTDWKTSTSIFNSLKEKSPEDPRPYFFESMMPFWEYFFIEQRGELAQEFLNQSEIAVKLSEKKLENSPRDTTTVLLLSGLHGYRSLVAAGEKEYRIAMNSGITGFKYTRQLLSLESDRPDAQIGRGMFYYMAGSVPREIRWLANAFGVSGDINRGFEELKKAAESDNPVSSDAMLMLMYLSEKEGMYEQALEYAEKLTHRFPENVIFLFKEAELSEKNNNSADAISIYKRIISLDNQYLKELSALANEKMDTLYSRDEKSD